MLREGDKAPAFELGSDGGEPVALAGFAGSSVVVYFYPRDNTPGCTREAQAFSAAMGDIAAAGAKVVGISRDSIASHHRFRDKYGLRFPLLSDPDLSVHRAYGAFGEKMMYGKKVSGVLRSTFVVGPAGRVMKVFPNVRVDGHVEAVLAVLRGGDDRAGVGAKRVVKDASRAVARKTPVGAGAKKTAAAGDGASKRGTEKGLKKSAPAAKEGPASARAAKKGARKR
jgi:thioredoxin-dependent peroxiredoxin